ncbi:Gypsy retrotransposon integrase-like protein 1 [Leucoagaricus gongylophorus]
MTNQLIGYLSHSSVNGKALTISMTAPAPTTSGSSSFNRNGATPIGESSRSQNSSQYKKRRIPGACDICKRKKIRCDSGEMPNNRCSSCTQCGFECTHKEVRKMLGSAKGYVESLEARLDKMDQLLTKLLPGINPTQEVDQLLEEVNDQDITAEQDEDQNAKDMIGKLAKLNLNPTQNRFFGKSSGYHLIQTALDLKSQYKGGIQDTTTPVELMQRRPEFWDIPPWASENLEMENMLPSYTFPPLDLVESLAKHYFTQINPFLPLLHRPTFKRGVDENLHLTDQCFGAVVLLVCALGSRYSEDSRVFVEGSNSVRSAGWKWFGQVRILRTSFFKQTSLHELQAYALSILFLQSSEIPQGCWSQVGMALRLAQEVGAHRRRPQNNHTPTADEELWKRAFW